MKLNKVLLGVTLAVSTQVVLAAEPAPVIEMSSSSSTSSSNQQLENLSKKLDARNRAQVNIQRQLDELQSEVNNLRGITELHTHQLSQVLERQRELYQELDRRVTQALQTTPTAPVQTTGTVDPQVNYSSDLTENEAYDRAVNLVLKDKKYEQAIPEFRNFNKKYPQSSYAANSHYWLGQLLFNKGELTEASTEFSFVVNNFKDSSKRSDAMLKLGMVAQKENNTNKAVSLYQQLVKEYPNSTAAQLAKPRLNSLNP